MAIAKKAPQDSQEAAILMAKSIDLAISKRMSGMYELNEPRNCTVKTRKSEYKNKPFIGGEAFSLSSCYVGKKGDVIAVFAPRFGVMEYQFMEMSVPVAMQKLNGFADFMNGDVKMIMADKNLTNWFDDKGESTRNDDGSAKMTQAQLDAAEKKRNAADLRFGSW